MIKSLILPEKSKRRRKFFLSKAKLSHIVSLSSFFAGFAIRSVANLQINENPDKTFLLMYVIITTLLVVCTCFVILVSLWVYPLLVTADVINEEIERLLKRQKKQNLRKHLNNLHGNMNPNPVKTPLRQSQSWLSNGLKTFKIHQTTVRLTEMAWLAAGTISVFLFIFDVIIVIWIKFQHFTHLGVIIATTILTAVIFGLGMFGIYFRLFVVQKFERLGTIRENTVAPGQNQHLQVPKKRNSYGSMEQGPSHEIQNGYTNRSSFKSTSRSNSITVV